VVQIQPYSETAVKVVKSIKPRQWDQVHLAWEIPSRAVDHLARKLYEAGQAVVVDGVPYDPLQAAPANPFMPLFAVLSERLRDKVFASLTTVFALDAGDEEGLLFAQLCDAVTAVQQEAEIATRVLQKIPPKTKPTRVKPATAEMKPVRRLVRKEAS
jgi:hypothetical protein